VSGGVELYENTTITFNFRGRQYISIAKGKQKTLQRVLKNDTVNILDNQEGGGDDFDDTYVYFFNKSTFKPDYLAYDFHVNGGGMRFREAYNERYVNGIRFVDYNNMKPIDENVSVLEVDKLFNKLVRAITTDMNSL